ncbi:MBL fold metallo-hydrolase [Bacillus albus]|uniref:MBL fold metallo-hydrolase n=1 Tax=Bacillus albus TaxID=2026189 RepID=UPI00141A5EDD|nr:MBL fold metallo-hydrolase [Bacillus albus]
MQQIKKIGNSFWYMTPVSETDRPILGMVVGKEKTLMIDAGNSEEHAKLFLEMLKEQNVSSTDFVALTHWHWDHIFGLPVLHNALTIAHDETKKEMQSLVSYEWTDEALDARVKEGTEIEFCADCIKKEFEEKARNIKIIPPVLTFQDQIELDLGEVTCVLKHVGGDHAHDSIVIYVKEEKILFLGDCIYADIFSSKWNYTTKRTFKLIDDLEKFDAEIYILSHGTAISRNEFLQEMHLLKTVGTYTEIHKGDEENIKEAYKRDVNRELNEDEIETITFFVNGYEMNDQ